MKKIAYLLLSKLLLKLNRRYAEYSRTASMLPDDSIGHEKVKLQLGILDTQIKLVVELRKPFVGKN